MLSDYQAKLPKVECTDKRFMDSIAELYKRDVISPKKTMDEAIGLFSQRWEKIYIDTTDHS